MIKRQRTFTHKCRFKETFRKIFFKQVLFSVTLTSVSFFFLPLQRLNSCEKQSKKELPPKKKTAVGKPLGSNSASKKTANFSRGSRTSVLTFPALYSGEDGSTTECYPAMQVVMLSHFLQNKCHHPTLSAFSLNTFAWHPRNRKHMTIPHSFIQGGYKHPKGPPQLL